MKVLDLQFVESKMLPRLERVIPEMTRYALELDQDAVSNAAAEAARQEAQAKGEAGVSKAPSKPPTQPVSPKLTKTRPPVLPEPERIEGTIEAKEVPAFINKTNLAEIERQKREALERTKAATRAQYTKTQEYKFHESKAGRSVEEIRREVEAQRNKELAFDSSFYNEAPDFQRDSPSVRLNAAAILKEDALYRKQQAKDAEVLRNYEEELRDPFEYYMWQQELRERDHQDKLKGVAMRRQQAKQSAIEAREAMLRQKEDNYSVANLMREQAEAIKAQKELEREVEMLQNQEVVQSVIEERSVKPQQAVRKVLEERGEVGRKVREELEAARLRKEEEDRREEEIKADSIRQLRALRPQGADRGVRSHPDRGHRPAGRDVLHGDAGAPEAREGARRGGRATKTPGDRRGEAAQGQPAGQSHGGDHACPGGEGTGQSAGPAALQGDQGEGGGRTQGGAGHCSGGSGEGAQREEGGSSCRAGCPAGRAGPHQAPTAVLGRRHGPSGRDARATAAAGSGTPGRCFGEGGAPQGRAHTAVPLKRPAEQDHHTKGRAQDEAGAGGGEGPAGRLREEGGHREDEGPHSGEEDHVPRRPAAARGHQVGAGGTQPIRGDHLAGLADQGAVHPAAGRQLADAERAGEPRL